MAFSEFQEVALYHPTAGFYASGGAGRGNDFITSPEVGPLFGMVVAEALDSWWSQLRRPRPFYVIEVGAGVGTLAQQIAEAEIECSPYLRYVMVERSEVLRLQQSDQVELSNIEDLYAPKLSGVGPAFFSMSTMPTETINGVILANELLDNMPIDLVEFWHHHWNHVCIGSHLGEAKEVLVTIEEEEPIFNAVSYFGKGAKDGSRLALQGQAQQWLRQALGLLETGRVVVFDYATDSRSMIKNPMEDWLRTYRNHRAGGAPWEAVGNQDITCDVAVDQLSFVKEPTSNRSQSEFLDAYGLSTFVADAREVWHGNSANSNLDAMRARARVQESRALTDDSGLGAHRVLEWEVKPRSDDDDK